MVMNNEGKYGGYIVQDLQEPGYMSDAFKEQYKKFARRILYMDTHVVPGAFQMNTSWYIGCTPVDELHGEHTHDFPEMIGFYGSDPENPNDLGAEIEFSIEGEKHLLNKSSLIYMPPGVKHLPLAIVKISRPVFHFSICMNPEYVDKLTSEQD